MEKQQKFLIIDGNSLAFRAFYALPFLTSSDGEPTGAVFGFMNMFLKVLDEAKPTHVAIAFDFGKKTFRNEIFAEYKGTRKETPEELRSQFPILKNLLALMGITVIEKEGFEADDIIGTLAGTLEGEKIVLSADRDLLQLIRPGVEIWLTQKGISEIHKMNEEELIKDFGVTPSGVIELKALMGDTSDNIPGISGIGPKTATGLVQQFGTVENVFKNLDSETISPKLREKLEAGKDSAFMSKVLATIKCDCDVVLDVEKCRLSVPFSDEAAKVIRALDMGSLLKKKPFFVVEDEPQLPALKALECKTITTLEELKKICDCSPKEMAFFLGKDLGFSFGEKFWYKVESEITLFCQPPEIGECLRVLAKFLEDKKLPKIVCDMKAQRHKLESFGYDILGDVFDIHLAAYILGNKAEQCEVGRFFAVKAIQQKDLAKMGLEKIYYEMELPLEGVLFEMENAGFAVDRAALEIFGKELEAQLDDLTKSIVGMAGEEFNLNSPKQTAVILFDKLMLSVEGNPNRSTSVDVLENLLEAHPIVGQILKYRKAQKLKSTYVDAFLAKLGEDGKIIHTIFNQTLATTGRLSSSEPNLQNLPVRDDEGKEIRKAFVSRFDGGSLVSADYNQIELRLLAHLSGDERMIDAFNRGDDIHTLTAMQMFGLEKKEVTQALRRRAKAINFGIVYGITNVGLAQNAGLSRGEAKEYIEKYFEVYPGVKAYLDKNVEDAIKKGYAITLFGRRRKILELKSDNHQTRQFGQRVAKNMPMQGSASDIIKFAMLKVAAALKNRDMKSKLILQIHDELVVDCVSEEIEEVKELLKECMESVVTLSVALPVSVESGKTYYDI